jgi:hypothetical protein
MFSFTSSLNASCEIARAVVFGGAIAVLFSTVSVSLSVCFRFYIFKL